MTKLTREELNIITALRKGLHDKRLSEPTRNAVYEGINAFWRLMAEKYQIDTSGVKDIREDGQLVMMPRWNP